MGGILLGGRRERRRKGEKGEGQRGEGKREGELTGRKNLVWKEEVVDEAN